MCNARLNINLPRIAGRWIAIFGALLLLSVSIACSGETPTDTPDVTSPPPTETVLAATATAPPAPTATAEAPPPTVAPTSASVPTVTVEPPTLTPIPFISAEHEAASEKIFSMVQELAEELGHREAGSPEEIEAAAKIKARFEAIGYSAELQPFALEFFDVNRYVETRGGNAQVIVESPMQVQTPGLLLSTAPKGAEPTRSLVAIGEGLAEDLQNSEVQGKIVLIQPGGIPVNDPNTLRDLLERANMAGAAGASAAIISGSISGMEQYAPPLGAVSSIPALVLPQAEMGEQLAVMSQSGDVTLTVKIETQALQSQNVVAELKGEGDGLVVVGGHYDVVPQTDTGPNDNTSGIAVVLALAEALAGESLPFSVRFIAFGAEEIGLFGSSFYVASLDEQELGSIKAMLNFDVIASGDLLAAAGIQSLTDLALKVSAGLGVKSEFQPLPSWASSDHVPFENEGVPVLTLYGPDVSRIHTPNDRLEFVQPERLGDAFLVGQALLRSEEFAR